MMYQRETSRRSIHLATRGTPLRVCVRRALNLERARLYSAVAAAGLASVTPLALGAAFPPVFPLGILLPPGGGDGSRGFVLTGIDAGDRAGCSVSAAGDVNGDGTDDLIIGAYRADPGGDYDAGESYVVFGSGLPGDRAAREPVPRGWW